MASPGGSPRSRWLKLTVFLLIVQVVLGVAAAVTAACNGFSQVLGETASGNQRLCGRAVGIERIP
jgi:hypothetical protein